MRSVDDSHRPPQRVAVVSIGGVLLASFIAASGVDYQDSRNSGLLGAPFYSLKVGLLLLVPLAVLALCRSRKRVAEGRGSDVSCFAGREICDGKT